MTILPSKDYSLIDDLRPIIETAIYEKVPTWEQTFPEGNVGTVVGVPDAAAIAVEAVINAGWRPL